MEVVMPNPGPHLSGYAFALLPAPSDNWVSVQIYCSHSEGLGATRQVQCPSIFSHHGSQDAENGPISMGFENVTGRPPESAWMAPQTRSCGNQNVSQTLKAPN